MMATVQKKPRRLPQLPSSKENDTDVKNNGKSGGSKGDGTKKQELPPPARRRDLPPLRRGVKRGGPETKSLMEMGRKSPPEVGQRSSLTATHNAKSCFFYIDNDYTFSPIKMVIHPKKHRKLDTVARDLSVRMKGLPFGVRSIYTPRGQHRIHNLEDLTQDGHYVCSSNRSYAHGMDVARVHSKFIWHHLRPDSGRRILNDLLKDSDLQGTQQRAGFRPGYDLSSVYTRVPPKKTTVMKNGEPDIRHTVLMNRRTAQTYEQVLLTLSELFGFAVRKLYTIDGILIDGLQKMLTGPDVLVAAGTEAFIHLNMDYGNQNRTRSHMSSNEDSSRVNIQSRLQTRRDRLAKTKGRWRVTIRTNALPSAGTQAQVTITVYGNKGNSGAITLGHGDGTNFQPGQVDDFTISVGNVGEIYKVRLAHDNTGDFPGWLCDEVYMRDLDTQEELTFSCRRWLARDEDDQEITRELAVKRPGEPILPLIKYQVDVVTGDVWGGGTEANIYLTIYGDRGDTGVRQLYTETKGVYFKQGQLDSFEVEAVSLGHLKRIIIGHDGTGPGSGWFLDKVVIREPPFRTNQECVFYCGKWLDEGEDDGKIVRELRVQDEYMDDILEKRNWEIEKWKYEKDCQVMLYSLMTAKALRLNMDLTVDGIGEDREKTAVFNVILKKPMKPMFASAANPSHYLAIDNGRITGLGKGGPYCEFRVRVQQDRTTLFESVKNALQFLTIEADGTTGEVRGILDKEPAKRFYVYAKGCFRHKGVIMFSTSPLQAINIVREDSSLTGRGKRSGPQAHFHVHKVSTGGIRMFESVANPGHYIRLKDGKIDCLGSRDEESHFLVLRHRDKGYVTLQSATQRGLFLGMTTDGRVHTTIDTGVRNIWLFPEVVEWGMPKTESTAVVEEEILERVRKDLTPDALVESPRGVKQYAEGDWSIHVSTITSLTNGDVALVAYGDKGNSGQIILGAPPGRPVFQDGNEDEFRANLAKIGKLFKIRLELIAKSSTKQPSWQVKEVRMQDLNTNEILRFNYDRWLSREEDDGEIMRELPVHRPGENVLPVHNYMVTVYTGKELGAETDAPVYITVHGERGDWGKRYLIHSNNNKKFRTGQVDVFYVEAVSLGHLQRCVIGHDGTGAGEGWYLEQVVIKEHDTATEEYLFPCHRWLDSSLEDQRIERALMVKASSPIKSVRGPSAAPSLEIIEEEDSVLLTSKQPTEVDDADEEQKTGIDSSGSYKLEIITGKESDAFNGGHVHITLYGDKGKSDQISLHASDSKIKVFEPGNIDQFTIDSPDLGVLYKVRVGRDDSDKWLRWYLEEVRVTDIKRDEKIVLSFNRWLARDMDDGDLCRELPVLGPGKDVLLLKQYVVQVYTGDHWGASTDANVFITMHGTRGDSGKRLLHKSSNSRVKFRRGQVDTFDFDVVDLEEFTSVLISHDGRGHGAGIFIDKVIIKEKDAKKSNVLYVFPCGRWLDDHEDNCVTERTLRMIDVIDANTIKTEISNNLKKTNAVWSLTVKTSNVQKAATTSKVFVSVYGTQGHSDKIPLTLPDAGVNHFTAGAESQFQISTGSIGQITKIRLQHDSSGSNPDFRVDYIKMMDKDSGEQLVFYIDRWLALGQDDGNICREMPVVRKGTPNLAVLRYIVAVVTGSYKDAGIDGEVSINLIGTDGDTGMRKLINAISKNQLPWQSGQTDIYMLEAVSIGKIKKIELSVNSATHTGRWYVQQVNIAEGARAASMYMGYCHSWIMANQSQVTEFTLSDVQISTVLLDSLESIPKGLERPVKSKGRWTVYVQTGTQNDSGTKEKVGIVLCGLKGESEVVCINSRDELNPGSFVKLEAKVPDIALLFKVRLFFIDKHVGSSWFMSKMKLKDQDTGEELHFEYNESLKSTNENPEGAIELPVIRPDLEPLKEKNYIVSVKTGNLPRAETTAHVFCNLIGQWGSSGQRLLSVSNLKEMFRAGQIDEFTVTCIELGDIQKVIIGHDRIGRGQGWYCDSVYVKAAEENMTIFPCERWLDTGCHDRKLSTELHPLSKFPLPYIVPTKYLKSKEGEWNIHVTTAGLDKLPMLKTAHKSGDISIVVYGSLAVKGPIELTNEDSQGPVNLIEPWKTVHFYNIDFGNIGEIQKIRVSSGYEGDTNALWTIAKVVIEDQMSHDQLTFDFRGKVGEVGGDIRKEMPLLKPGGTNRKIVQYYIEVHTGEEEINSSTNANVFITLYGLNSDSGRRHLIHSKNTQKRFQTGQVDKFVLEAVDLGDFDKLVVAKGPGKPWLLDKIVIKKGQYAPEEHIFMFSSWIGDKDNIDREIEETLKLTATIPSQVAIPIEEAVDLQLSKGSWTMESVTGGRRGPDGPLDMVMVFCGQQGESSQITLKSNRDNPFQIGQSDIFKLKYVETIGNIRKIRIGFKDQIVTKAWFVRKMTFEDNDNHDIFWLDFNDWIAIDHKLDGWKEFPVPWPAVHVPPVVHYLVTVQTGDVHTNTENPNVYIYIYGDQGGTGCRLLKHSMSNTEIFKKNQVDVFEIEAVHLGELVKLTIGHDNQAKDAGWYIERVLVQESKDADQILFECNRWLDAGQGDGLNEHTLFPENFGAQQFDNKNNNKEEPGEIIVPLISKKPSSLIDIKETAHDELEEKPVTEEAPSFSHPEKKRDHLELEEVTPMASSQGMKYNVTVTTGGDAGAGVSIPVVVVLYGEKGHSKPTLIGQATDFSFTFGNTDNFEVFITEDIGPLYKVRVGFQGEENHPEWYSDITKTPVWIVDKLTIRNEVDMEVYEFEAPIQVKITKYQDFWQEIPVKKSDRLQIFQYVVCMYTSEESISVPDDNVYLQIFGECGDTGYRRLMASKTNTHRFHKGNKDVFEIGAVDLGKLEKIQIKLDGSSPQSGFQLDRVVIKESEETTIQYVFKCERWLNGDSGEDGAQQTLMLSEILVSDEVDKSAIVSGYQWKVVVVTGDEDNSCDQWPVELILYMQDGHYQSVIIGENFDSKFSPGALYSFNVTLMEEIEDLYKIRLGFHGGDSEMEWIHDFSKAPSWFIEQISLTDEMKGKLYEIKTATWLKMDTYQDFWREQPIRQANGKTAPLYQYHVEVYTGNQSKVVGTNANVLLCIYGESGDTGFRRLMASKTNAIKFEKGNCDIFELNAVDLGVLTKVSITCSVPEAGPGWYLEKVIVKETEKSLTKYVFKCDKWFGMEDEEIPASHTFTLTELLAEDQEENISDEGNDWTVWCVTGSYEGDEKDNAVELILYGDQGHSKPVIIGGQEDFQFNTGQVDVFEVKVEGEVGKLYKVRVGFHGSRHEVPWYNNYHLAPSWFIESMRLKDETSGVEYELEAGVSVQVEKYTDFWRELPVVNMDYMLNAYKYDVEIYCGEKVREDVNVSVQIYGQRGDTGLRRLMDSKTNKNKFQEGQKDVFEIRAVDLGELIKVKVTHDGYGPGSGLLLDKVVVKETEDSVNQYVFECGKWLEDGTKGHEVEITLPLSDITEMAPEEQRAEPEQKAQAGQWKVLITTCGEEDSGTDSNVSLTICGDADSSEPISIGSSQLGHFSSGNTDEFEIFLDPEVIGQIRKIRLEHDNSVNPWQVEKVVMKNMHDGSQLEFPINKWLTLDKPGSDIVVEVPTTRHDWPVRDYVVSTLTGDGFGSGTDAAVYINLIGTLGDTGKRYLVHSLEGNEDKFQSGQTDTFIIQAVDLGRLINVQIGHHGEGPGSGWFLKTVTVKESMQTQERYVFKCEQWLSSEKNDGLTERLLAQDFIDKSQAEISFKKVTDNVDDGEHIKSDMDPHNEDFSHQDINRQLLEEGHIVNENHKPKNEYEKLVRKHTDKENHGFEQSSENILEKSDNGHNGTEGRPKKTDSKVENGSAKQGARDGEVQDELSHKVKREGSTTYRVNKDAK